MSELIFIFVWIDFYFLVPPPPLWFQSHFLYHCGIELDHLGIWRTASNHLHTQATVLCLRSYFSLRSEFTSSSGNLWWRKTDQVNLWMSLFGGFFFGGGSPGKTKFKLSRDADGYVLFPSGFCWMMHQYLWRESRDVKQINKVSVLWRRWLNLWLDEWTRLIMSTSKSPISLSG